MGGMLTLPFLSHCVCACVCVMGIFAPADHKKTMWLLPYLRSDLGCFEATLYVKCIYSQSELKKKRGDVLLVGLQTNNKQTNKGVWCFQVALK